MSVPTIQELDRHLRHAWTEPKALLGLEAPFPWPGTGVDEIDPDWWEPRYDQPWRRQVARDREAFGGEYVAKAKSPIEGPNNPDRLRRELENAEFDHAEAHLRLEEAQREEEEAVERIRSLSMRLEEVTA